MIPARLITTWITPPEDDQYADQHRLLFAHCFSSWLRVMPDYEIEIITLGTLLEWDLPPYVEAWLEAGQYVAVANWARVQALASRGGCYLDMDVEARARLDQVRASGTCVVGHYGGGQDWCNNGVILAEAGHPMLGQVLHLLQTADPEGNETGPRIWSRELHRRGWDGQDRRAEVWGVTVLPHEVFYPYHWSEYYRPDCVTEDTVLVHHWARSWFRRAGLSVPEHVWFGPMTSSWEH